MKKNISLIFSLFALASCAASNTLENYVDDRKATDHIDLIKSANLHEDILHLCVIATDYLRKEEFEYSLKLDLENASAKYAAEYLEQKPSGKYWHYPTLEIRKENIEYSGCSKEVLGKRLTIIYVMEYRDPEDYSDDGWYEIDNPEQYKGFRATPDLSLVKPRSGSIFEVLEKENLLPDQGIIFVKRNDGYPGSEPFYHDTERKFGPITYISFDLPDRTIPGNKSLNILTPLALVVDLVTLPIQAIFFISYSQSH